MIKKSKLSAAVAGFGIVFATNSLAEDIDIYTQGTSNSAPNVLLFVDNSSNWSAANQAWVKSDVLAKCQNDDCKKYTEAVFGSETKLVQGQVEIRALRAVLQELACTSGKFKINVGLMLYNTAGTVDSNSAVSGYIQRRILPLAPSSAGCVDLIADLDRIDGQITSNDYKGPSSTDYGTSLFEAFKYFGGYANTNDAEATAMGSPSGAKGFGPVRYSNATTLEDTLAFETVSKNKYKGPIDENFCGKNYIVLIGNQFPNQEFGTNQNTNPPVNQVMKYLGLSPTQLYDTQNKADIRFADEWSEFLASTDVSSVPGHQPVKTFTINVFNKQEDLKQTALLDSMALNGGSGVGGAFKVDGDLGALVDALTRIFTQISAVNSAFASASLPISVNTQGTYLNQVFIGMFRPDGNQRPRWAGNLKQYQFKLRETSTGDTVQRELFLADDGGNPAIDNANTGFIEGCARSIWTTSSDNYWESVTETEENKDIYGIPKGSCEKFEHNDSPDGSIVERGGAAQKLRSRSPSSRTLYTCESSDCTSDAPVSLTSDILQWLRGDNIGDGYNTGDGSDVADVVADDVTYGKPTTGMRPTLHGGVIHSRPLAINYGASGTDDVVVFYGADDGLLRAINGNKVSTDTQRGEELWAFMAPEFESRLQRNRDNFPFVQFFDLPDDDTAKAKDYFFDGSLGAYVGPANADGTGAAVKYVYAAMRRGGRMIYAFDATTHPKTTPPDPLWRFGCPATGTTGCVGGTNIAKIGLTWSTPKIIRVKGQSALYTVFGAGYNDCEDTEPRDCTGSTTGRGIFVLNATTGAELRFIDFGTSAGHVVGDVVPIDTNNDGFSDVLYAADTLGNVWRINLSDPTLSGTQNQDNWILTHVAKLADWTVEARSRKFLYAPDVVTVGTFNIVLLGSGNREKPLDTSKAAKVKNRFYGIWDEFAITSKTSPGSFVMIDDSTDCDAPNNLELSSGCQLMNTSTSTLDYLPTFSSTVTRPRGWVIDLDQTTAGGPNEQVVTSAATVGGLVNFSTFQAVNLDKCSALGTARGYAACFLHGGATCGTPPTEATSRSEIFVGGGLPPSPVAGVVEIDGRIVPFIIGGKPNSPGGSALEAKLPKIPIKKDRTKVYRYKRID